MQEVIWSCDKQAYFCPFCFEELIEKDEVTLKCLKSNKEWKWQEKSKAKEFGWINC